MNVHGMPLGALLNADNARHARRPIDARTWVEWRRLKHLGRRRLCPKIRPEDVVLVDARALEPEEWISARTHGVQVFTPTDRQRLGIVGLLGAIEYQLRACDVIYVSFDVDAVDAALAPGTGCPVANGLSWVEARALVGGLMRLPAVQALEVAEFNPHLDQDRVTLDGICGVLRHAWPGLWPFESMSSAMGVSATP
jgi:arginase